MEENPHSARAVIWDAGMSWPAGAQRVEGKEFSMKAQKAKPHMLGMLSRSSWHS